LSFEYGGSATGYVGNQFDGFDFNNQYQANRHHIWLNGASEQMRLTSTGLGIGTTNPTEKLDVSGNGKFTLVSSVGSINLRNLSTTSTELHIRPNSGKNGWLSFTEDSVADRWIVGVKNGNGSLFFNTGSVGSNTDRMVLDSSGNLGLGVTPSAWRSTERAFEVGATAALTSVSDQARVYNNAYVDGTPTIRYKVNGFATQYQQSEFGTHAWFNAPSGTAGNAISFTQALTLDANRNLALNTTSVGTSAVGVLSVGSGTEPSSGPADTVQIYSVDRSAGNTIPAIYCEGSGVTNAGITNVTVTHKIAIKVNGTVYYLLATTDAT
jgi:hypothetical protein